MAKLNAPNGATVQVADDRVEGLIRFGFTEPKVEKKAPAKKSSSSKSGK